MAIHGPMAPFRGALGKPGARRPGAARGVAHDGAQRRAGLQPTTGPRAQGGARGGEATWEATWELAIKNEIFVHFANLNMAMEIVGLPIEHGDFPWFLSKNGN